MPDMLVKLYNIDFQSADALYEDLRKEKIAIQPAMAPNLTKIRDWITANFYQPWAD